MISIVTPVLNGAEFIENNIKSIQKLNVPFEHIIVDGGSTDGTLDIVAKYPHLELLHQEEKKGMYQAIDIGFKAAKGDIITWVNCDDLVLKKGYEAMYNYIKKNNVDLVYSNAYFVDRTGDIIKKIKGKYFPKLLLKNGMFPLVQPASIYKRELYFSVGGLNFENFKITGDLDLFYRFALKDSAVFKKLNVYSVKFLKYGESLGDLNVELGLKERDRAQIPRPGLFIRGLNKLLGI